MTKKIERMNYRVAYNRYYMNQYDSDDCRTYEQAKHMIKYRNEWERNAHIESVTVWYDDGTCDTFKGCGKHIARA